MSDQSQNQPIKPWYKQGWPWFIISIPLATVIAGIATLIIANLEPSSMVVDDYFKRGLAINQSLAKLERAKALKLSGKLYFNSSGQVLKVRFAADSQVDSNEKLKVNLFHPTLASKDREIQLQWLAGKEYVGELKAVEPANWYFTLQSTTKNWAIKGRWDSKKLVVPF